METQHETAKGQRINPNTIHPTLSNLNKGHTPMGTHATPETSLHANAPAKNTVSGAKAFQLSKAPAEMKIWTLRFDLPGEKVNKLSKAVMSEFDEVLGELKEKHSQGEIDVLVLCSGKPGNFIAGADIEMIQSARTPEEAEELARTGQKLVDRWEDLPFPTVAAVNGAALGGGCEFALACSAIVMSNDSAAKIGLPEVLLGLMPGMGGTVRLPRKIGLANALDLILTGKTLSGERAYKMGLVEACLPKENFEASAIQWAKTHLKVLRASLDPTSEKRIGKEPKLGGMGGALGKLLENTPARAVIFRKAREGVLSKTKGHYPAPLEAIATIQANSVEYGPKLRGKERDRAMVREARGFGKLAATEVSQNLIRLFFLTEGVKKSKGLPEGVNAMVHSIHQGGVLGAGVMGGGIAQLFANKDIPTRMKDISNKSLSLGIQSAAQIFKKQVQKKRLSSRSFLQKLNHIAPVLDYSGFHATDLVVEAIIENMDIKKKAFEELEGHVKPECIIATNTSSLSVSEMQKALKHPERFGGMHFFNPVNKMPLVEVIRGEKSSDDTVATIFQFCKKLGKTPIVVKDSPGFLVNRLLAPYLNEAAYLVVEGVPIPEIDRIMVEFGMPMGPMELIDEVGIDVGDKVAHILHQAFGDRMNPCPQNSKIVAAGRLGKKNGKGLYEYEGPKHTKTFKEEIYSIMGVTPRPGMIAHEEIIERCILPMINEATRCLEEEVVATAADVDLGMIMGTGFPPFRGGLLRYADTLGAKTIVDRLKHYEARFGMRYAPATALLAKAARSYEEGGHTFY